MGTIMNGSNARLSFRWKTIPSPFREGDTLRVMISPSSRELAQTRAANEANSGKSDPAHNSEPTKDSSK